MIRSRYALFLGFALGLLAAVVVASLLLRKPYQYRGSLIEPARPASDFTLTAGDGRPFTLSTQRGRAVLIFFGYTHCPDVCPVALSEYKQIRRRLGSTADSVTYLFITVDPERDTPQVIGDYTGLFDPAIIGLTGTLDALEPVWQAYGVVRTVHPPENGTYLVDHTARTYLIDLDGNLRLTYPFGFGAEGVAEDLLHLLAERNE
ncbi:MAG: SCO family protein [Chloroflexota bacterium]